MMKVFFHIYFVCCNLQISVHGRNSEISENDDTAVRGALKKFPEWWYCTAMVGLMAMLT